MDSTVKQNIFLWALYDFANSFVYIAFFLYFSQWVVVDRQIPDIWFNLCFALSSLALLLTAPFIGAMLDRKWKNISGLRAVSAAIIFFYSLTAISALGNRDFLALVFFTIGLYFFTLSFTFYTPLINVIAPHEKRGLVSGIGFAGNFLGNIAGLILALPFATGKIDIFNALNRAETILPAIAAFFIFSLPILLFFKEPKKIDDQASDENCLQKTKKLFSYPGILLFLIAFIFFSGAIVTTINNFPIILERIWSVSDTAKTYILLASITASAIGSLIFGHLSDHFGGKKTLVGIIISLAAAFYLLAATFNLIGCIIITIIASLFIGGSMAVSRAMMSHLVRENNRNLGFAYYNVIERASALIGPLAWGLTVLGFSNAGTVRYRLALMMMSVIICLSLPFLLKISSSEKFFLPRSSQ